MIDRIELENFKCFKHTKLDLKTLNLFSGINGMGKSTVIQSLLLLKQSFEQDYLPNRISLNGNYVNIGTGQDLLYENAENDDIRISIFDKSKCYSANMIYDGLSDVLELNEYNDEIKGLLQVPFEYLNAERNSPQSIYPKSSYYVDSKLTLGIHGQYTVHYLAKHQDDKLLWDSCNSPELTLKGAVQYWLNEISPNIKFDAHEIAKTDLTQLGYYFNTERGPSNTYRPTNVGFGISYILPVIVALVKAEPESIVIIENPEAHLHPKGQRKMGELLSKCAANNIQVFVETHSDHVMNGVRIAVKKEIISPTNVNFMFFNKEEIDGTLVHNIETPKINSKGKLDYWPDGFFDEWDKALDEII